MLVSAVIEECKQRLVARGYCELSEKESWKIIPEGKVFAQLCGLDCNQW